MSGSFAKLRRWAGLLSYQLLMRLPWKDLRFFNENQKKVLLLPSVNNHV
jgi:hypothetical protein